MNKNELEVFEKLEDQVMLYADDNNYKESFAYFKIGEIEKLVDISRGLIQKVKDNYDTIDLLHAVINEKNDIINRLYKIIDDLREYMLDIDYKMGWQYAEYLDELLGIKSNYKKYGIAIDLKEEEKNE